MFQRAEPVITVDLIRCACAAMVAAHHYLAALWLTPDPDPARLVAGIAPPADGLIAVARSGSVGVELFFIISGMMIAQSACYAGPRLFLRKRLLRLVPAVWICASITLLVLLGAGRGAPDLMARWARAVLFVPWGPRLDPSYWTLAVEVSFYLLVAATVAGRGSRAMTRLADGLLVTSAAFWIGCVVIGPPVAGHVNDVAVQLLLLPHGCLFALGIVIALSQADGWSRGRVVRALALGALCLVETYAHAVENGLTVRIPPDASLPLLFICVGTALLIAADRLQPHLRAWISPSAARTIGLLTFPLYLLHQQIGYVVIAHLCRAGLPAEAAAAITLAIMFAAAWLIVRHVEPRVRRGLERLLTRRAPGAAPAAMPA